MNVIDAIAPDASRAALNQLDGYHTKDAQRPFTLHLAGAEIDNVSAGVLHALPEHGHRPEPDLDAASSPA